MNFKTTIVLLVLLLLVGGVLWFTQNGGHKAEDQASNQPAGPGGQKLGDLDPDHIIGVTIVNAAGEHTSLQKTGETWRLIEPADAPAVTWASSNLVRTLVDARSQGTPYNAPGADAGLDKPRYRVELTTDDGKSEHLIIGNKTGVGDVMYAQVNGGDVNLISADLDKTLKSAADDVRDKRLFAMRDVDVKQFRVTSNQKELTGKLVNGKWVMQWRPIAGSENAVNAHAQLSNPAPSTDVPGDAPSILSWLASITNTEATEFLKPDSEELVFARFNKPTLEAWVSPETASTRPASTEPAVTEPAGGITLTVGSPDSLSRDHYFVQMSDGQFAKISKDALDAMKKTILDLRDKDVTTIAPASVMQISILKEIYAPPATQPTTLPTTTPTTNPAATTLASEAPTTTLPTESVATTRPLSSELIVMARRPSLPATMATTTATSPAATTAATSAPSETHPSTPPEMQSAWQFSFPYNSKVPVDEAKMTALLSKFQPLHADKFLEQSPASQPLQRYVISITTGPSSTQQFEVLQPSNGGNPIAIYNGLSFEVAGTLLDALNVDFRKNPG